MSFSFCGLKPNFPQQCTHEIPRISMSFSVFWLNSQLSSAIHPVLPHPQRPAHQWGIVEGHHAVAQGGNQSQGPHGGVPMELNVFTWSRYKNDDLPSGKLRACYRKAPFSIGKSSTNGPCSTAMSVYWRV